MVQFGTTPLMEASLSDQVEAVKILLDHGAELEFKHKVRGLD